MAVGSKFPALAAGVLAWNLVASAAYAESGDPYAWVLLKFTVTAKGEAADIEIVESVPDGRFDDAAVTALKGAQLPIREEGGRPISYRATQKVAFDRPEPKDLMHKLAQVDALIRTCRIDYASRVLTQPPHPAEEKEQLETSARLLEIALLEYNWSRAMKLIDSLLADAGRDSYFMQQLMLQKAWVLMQERQFEDADRLLTRYLSESSSLSPSEIHLVHVAAAAQTGALKKARRLLDQYSASAANWSKYDDWSTRPAEGDGLRKPKPFLAPYIEKFQEGFRRAEAASTANSPEISWLDMVFGERLPDFVLRVAKLYPAYRHPPRYPRAALRRRQNGGVLLEVDVDERGFVTDAKVVAADPPDVFERVSLEAIGHWRYVPHYENCRPAPYRGLQPIHFRAH